MKETRENGSTLEMMYDDIALWQVQSFPRATRRRDSQAVLTLHDFFRTTQRMSLKDKCILSVILAKSLLDFSESKWVSGWSKESISFLSVVAGSIDFRRPCLTTDFKSPGSGGNIRGQDDGVSMYQLHPCPPLLQLAIILLELQKGDTIESMRSEEDLVDGRPNRNTDFITAIRVIDDIVDDIRVDSRNAVKACLECNFNTKQCPSFDDEDFRKAVYTQIVAPLEKELYDGFKIMVEDLPLDD
jgi:hypothetical protein